MNTLGEFIVQKQAEYPNAKGELSAILAAIRLVAKIIHRDINRAGLTDDIIGISGEENVQGETQMKLDVFAHEKMKKALLARGEVAGFASEEEENIVIFDNEQARNSKYVVLADPLDGSSNIDVNVAVGTIFSIYKRVTPIGEPVTLEDFLQEGNKQVAAGYIVYGSSTMLVYTTGNGTNGFTYDPRYIQYCKADEPSTNRPYSARYVGSLVSDFHRNMLKGGIYLYPQSTNYANGKLRLLYEGNPIAFLAEQAGGMATDGKQRILDIKATELHQRVPFFVGSSKMMQKLHSFLEEE